MELSAYLIMVRARGLFLWEGAPRMFERVLNTPLILLKLLSLSTICEGVHCGICSGLWMGFVYMNLVYGLSIWPLHILWMRSMFFWMNISIQPTLQWRRSWILFKLQILISMMKVIWLNDRKNANKVLNFTWLPLVWTMIHRCKHYYFTVLGQMHRTFLCI